MESPSHGIVAPDNALISNLKFLGWHSNNDAVRVGSNSEIKNSFLRAVDDHFYNFNLHVHDVVLWAGHNGSIMTYGWGGDGGNTYNAGGSVMTRIEIIHPEWVSLGNNNGLIMSQVGCDFKPYGYGGDATTVIKNIRIEGSIPGITNLKPRTGDGNQIIAQEVSDNKIGYIGDLILENITVESQYSKGLMKGKSNATPGGLTCYVKDIDLNNVTIGGVQVTKANYRNYFDVELLTTENISFNGQEIHYVNPDDVTRIEAEDYVNMLGVNTEETSDEGGGLNVTSIMSGNYTEYDLTLDEGTYEITFRAATALFGGYIKLYVNDVYKTRVLVDQSKTDGWQDWYTTEPVVLDLSTDNHIKLEFFGAAGTLFNLNWMELYALSKTPVNKNIIEDFKIYSKGRNINIQSMYHDTYDVCIYDLSGRKAVNYIGLSNFQSIPLNNSGVYIIQLVTDKSGIITKKVLVP